MPEEAVQPEPAAPSLLNVPLTVPSENEKAGIVQGVESRQGLSIWVPQSPWQTGPHPCAEERGLGGDTCPVNCEGLSPQRNIISSLAFLKVKTPKLHCKRQCSLVVFFLLVLRTGDQNPCLDPHVALPLHQLLRCTMLDCRLCSNVYFVVGFLGFFGIQLLPLFVKSCYKYIYII